MVGGNGTQQTTTSSNSEPWSVAQPFLENSMNYASGLVDAGVGAQVPTISTAIPFSDQSIAGLNGMQSTAENNMGGNGLSGFYNSIMQNGGFTGDQQTANNTFTSFANGSGSAPFSALANDARANPTFSGFMSAAGSAGNPSYSESNLSNWANGSMMGQQNPYFEQALGYAMQDQQDSVDLMASGAGRYGSGQHTSVLADSMGQLSANARTQQFENDRNAQFQANNQMDTFRNANFSNALNALGGASNAYQTGIGQALGAQQAGTGLTMTGASNLFNSGQQGFSNAANAYQGAMLPYQTMMGVGGNYENLAANIRQDELNQFNLSQSLPWDNLARANAIYSGAGALGGTSTGTATTPGQNPFATALGYGATGVGILGGMQDLGWF